MDKREACFTVAHDLVARAALAALDDELIGWEDYPDIGEADWAEVVTIARMQAAKQFMPHDGAAYWFLAERADGGDA